ncbi:MAG: hypothetical protein AB1422_00895 [bacterium]
MKKKELTIFSTGVHLQAIKCMINDKKQWRWVAISFEDESFMDGKSINPIEYAQKQDKLIEEFESE